MHRRLFLTTLAAGVAAGAGLASGTAQAAPVGAPATDLAGVRAALGPAPASEPTLLRWLGWRTALARWRRLAPGRLGSGLAAPPLLGPASVGSPSLGSAASLLLQSLGRAGLPPALLAPPHLVVTPLPL